MTTTQDDRPGGYARLGPNSQLLNYGAVVADLRYDDPRLDSYGPELFAEMDEQAYQTYLLTSGLAGDWTYRDTALVNRYTVVRANGYQAKSWSEQDYAEMSESPAPPPRDGTALPLETHRVMTVVSRAASAASPADPFAVLPRGTRRVPEEPPAHSGDPSGRTEEREPEAPLCDKCGTPLELGLHLAAGFDPSWACPLCEAAAGGRWVAIRGENGFKTHFCDARLAAPLMAELRERGAGDVRWEPADGGFVDLPGMALADRAISEIALGRFGQFALRIPATDVPYFRGEMEGLPLRRFADGQEYYKLHGWRACVVFLPLQLSEALMRIADDAVRQAEEELGRLDDAIAGVMEDMVATYDREIAAKEGMIEVLENLPQLDIPEHHTALDDPAEAEALRDRLTEMVDAGGLPPSWEDRAIDTVFSYRPDQEWLDTAEGLFQDLADMDGYHAWESHHDPDRDPDPDWGAAPPAPPSPPAPPAPTGGGGEPEAPSDAPSSEPPARDDAAVRQPTYQSVPADKRGEAIAEAGLKVRVQLTSYEGGRYLKGAADNYMVQGASGSRVREALDPLLEMAKARFGKKKGGKRLRVQITEQSGKGSAYLKQDGSAPEAFNLSVPGITSTSGSPLVDYLLAAAFGERRRDARELAVAWRRFESLPVESEGGSQKPEGGVPREEAPSPASGAPENRPNAVQPTAAAPAREADPPKAKTRPATKTGNAGNTVQPSNLDGFGDDPSREEVLGIAKRVRKLDRGLADMLANAGGPAKTALYQEALGLLRDNERSGG